MSIKVGKNKQLLTNKTAFCNRILFLLPYFPPLNPPPKVRDVRQIPKSSRSANIILAFSLRHRTSMFNSLARRRLGTHVPEETSRTTILFQSVMSTWRPTGSKPGSPQRCKDARWKDCGRGGEACRVSNADRSLGTISLGGKSLRIVNTDVKSA